jgi:hypothetical protein
VYNNCQWCTALISQSVTRDSELFGKQERATIEDVHTQNHQWWVPKQPTRRLKSSGQIPYLAAKIPSHKHMHDWASHKMIMPKPYCQPTPAVTNGLLACTSSQPE